MPVANRYSGRLQCEVATGWIPAPTFSTSMELLDHFRRQFTYDEWANREVLAGLKASAKSPTRAAATSRAHSFRRALVAGAPEATAAKSSCLARFHVRSV